MSITELGALGEFIGSIVVLVTLVVLILQIRQNTLAIRAAAMQSIFDSNQQVHFNLMQPGIAEHIAAVTGQEVSSIVYNRFLFTSLRAQENIFIQMKNGLIGTDYANLEQRARLIKGTPGFDEFWEDQKLVLTNDFALFFESVRPFTER